MSQTVRSCVAGFVRTGALVNARVYANTPVLLVHERTEIVNSTADRLGVWLSGDNICVIDVADNGGLLGAQVMTPVCARVHMIQMVGFGQL